MIYAYYSLYDIYQHEHSESSLISLEEVMVYAMCTGRASDSVHLDMQQASNLIDFMETAESTSALARMMDDRSNPETYQVSNVAEGALKDIFKALKRLFEETARGRPICLT